MHRSILQVAGWLLPPLLAVLFFVKGQRYNPDYFEPPASAFRALPIPSAVGDWTLGDGAVLPADRMFEKINGKASYYLQYGALELCTGEWVLQGQRWDMYLYRFKDGTGARGAYNGERPSNGVAVEGLEGYTVPGQAAIVSGPFYLQLNAQTANADAGIAAGLALELGNVLGGKGGDAQAGMVIDLVKLAGGDLVGETEGFLPESAFGFSVLNHVRTVNISLADTEAAWFTAPGNAETIAAYAEELSMYGGENLFNGNGGSGGSMFGVWEFAGLVDGAVWGIHNAPSREALLQHWDALNARLKTRLEEP